MYIFLYSRTKSGKKLATDGIA